MFGNGESQLVITQTIDGIAETVSESGTIVRCYDPYNDAPIEVEMKRNWFKLATKLLLAAAIVLAVAAIAAAVVVTGGAALGATVAFGAVFKGFVVAAAIGGAICGAASVTMDAASGESLGNIIYNGIDAFANGAILTVCVEAATTIWPDKWGAVAFSAGLGSASYQGVDKLLDLIFGHDYDDEEGGFVLNVICDVVAGLIAYKIAKIMRDELKGVLNSIENATWKEYFGLAKLANSKYGGNFRTVITKFKQTKTLPKRNIEQVKRFLLEVIEKKYGTSSMIYKGIDAGGNYLSEFVGMIINEGSEVASDYFFEEEDTKLELKFKFDDSDRLVILTE